MYWRLAHAEQHAKRNETRNIIFSHMRAEVKAEGIRQRLAHRRNKPLRLRCWDFVSDINYMWCIVVWQTHQIDVNKTVSLRRYVDQLWAKYSIKSMTDKSADTIPLVAIELFFCANFCCCQNSQRSLFPISFFRTPVLFIYISVLRFAVTMENLKN